MRKPLPLFFLLTGTLSLSLLSQAQQTDRFAYAITDVQAPGGNWSFLRKLDLSNGTWSPILLTGNEPNIQAFDAGTRQPLGAPLQDARYGNYANAAFATGVAAAAYDRKQDRLWYTPMFLDQLRYVDLKSMNVYYYTGLSLAGTAEKAADQSNIITRMTLGGDGNGYALTNDGNTLIRFSAGRKSVNVEILGALVDDPANGTQSIHNACSSYGGDMIADDNGHLYILTARNSVYKVNIERRIATFLGMINGLPAGFTVNGAAVTDNNQVLVTSALAATSLYTVDLRSLQATAFVTAGPVWQTSDLANGNVYKSGNKAPAPTLELTSRNTPANSGDGKISIYPNPTTNNQFVLQFNDLPAGTYNLQVTDVTGRQLIQQVFSLSGDQQVQPVRLDASAARGIYLIKVTDTQNKTAYTSKVMVQ